jgi:hypothetical protein
MLDDSTFGFNKPDALELVQLIGNTDREHSDWHPLGGESGGATILAITTGGGIAARSTSAVPHTFPSGTVNLLDPSTGDYYSPNQTATAYNSTTITIDSGHVIQAKMIGGRYFVDVDDCG